MSAKYIVKRIQGNGQHSFELTELTPEGIEQSTLQSLQKGYSESRGINIDTVENWTQQLRDLANITEIVEIGEFFGTLSYKKRSKDYILEVRNKRYYSDEHKKVLFAFLDEFFTGRLFDLIILGSNKTTYFIQESKANSFEAVNRIYDEFRARINSVISELEDESLKRVVTKICDGFSVLGRSWFDELNKTITEMINIFEDFIDTLPRESKQKVREFTDNMWYEWILRETKTYNKER